jgi:acylphosphatase
MKRQVRVHYAGRVQGVGFRFTAESIAGKLGVTGWVKNLRDDRVEIVAEAEEETLKEFLRQIYEYFSRYIRDVNVQWLEASGEYKEFGVSF